MVARGCIETELGGAFVGGGLGFVGARGEDVAESGSGVCGEIGLVVVIPFLEDEFASLFVEQLGIKLVVGDRRLEFDLEGGYVAAGWGVCGTASGRGRYLGVLVGNFVDGEEDDGFAGLVVF